jgi:uncharacterized protein YbbC (DUF1343 family)
MLVEARRASGERWSWTAAHIDRLAGTDGLRLGIDRGLTVPELVAGWEGARAAFEALRAPYLIYR